MRIKQYVMAAAAAVISAPTVAQSAAAGGEVLGYPVRPIRMIVPAAAGGLSDIHARLIANALSTQMRRQVVVENRPGASGIIAYEAMARAAPDGYTLGYASFNMVTNPSLFANLPYDTFGDFQRVIRQTYSVNLLTVTPALPVKSVTELIAYGRTHPNVLSFGSPGAASSQYLAVALLKQMTGAHLMHVSYKGIQQAINDTISGEIHVVCDNLGSILPHARAGRLRPIGVTASTRSSVIPEVPTIAEAGLSRFEVTPSSGYVVPSRVPREIVLRLNAELNKALDSVAVREKLVAYGSVPVGGTPEQFTEHLRREIAKWGAVIKAAGIRPE